MWLNPLWPLTSVRISCGKSKSSKVTANSNTPMTEETTTMHDKDAPVKQGLCAHPEGLCRLLRHWSKVQDRKEWPHIPDHIFLHRVFPFATLWHPLFSCREDFTWVRAVQVLSVSPALVVSDAAQTLPVYRHPQPHAARAVGRRSLAG